MVSQFKMSHSGTVVTSQQSCGAYLPSQIGLLGIPVSTLQQCAPLDKNLSPWASVSHRKSRTATASLVVINRMTKVKESV